MLEVALKVSEYLSHVTELQLRQETEDDYNCNLLVFGFWYSSFPFGELTSLTAYSNAPTPNNHITVLDGTINVH